MTDIWARKSYFLTLFCEHILISFLALFLVTILGISIGVLVFYSKRSRAIILPLVNFLYTIPSIAMFGLLIPLVGIGFNNAIIVLVLYGLLPIVRNTYTGIKEVPHQYINAARGLGTTKKQIFFRIYFPLALPSILSGLRVTTVMVIALTGLAALIGAGGLGQAIFRGLNTMNTDLIVAGSLGISLFAIFGDKFIGQFEKDAKLQRIISGNASIKTKIKIFTNIFVLLLLLITSFSFLNPQYKSDNNTITIASKPTSEQFILGEILAQQIENNTNIHVIRKFGIGGGTTNIHPALLSGDIDAYVEYTGTAIMNVLKYNYSDLGNKSLEILYSEYEKRYNLEWLGLLGFNNTYAIAISEQEANNKRITTCSDLVPYSSNYIFGAEFDFFERPDAYNGLIKVYPFKFHKLSEMDINLRYKAMEEGKVQVIDAFTTDAQIEALNLKILKDDKNFFPSYKAGIVVRKDILRKYPKLKSILILLNNSINTNEMRKMNYEVEINKKSPRQVAKNFLENNINK